MDIRLAVSPKDFELARELLREYVQTPGVAVCAVGFEDELRTLEASYDVVLLAYHEGLAAGCGALRTIAPGVGEIKRIYVRHEARGTGVGRALTLALLDRARGLRVVRLDTLPSMGSAIRMYESLGFRRIPAYSPANPPDALCFELTIA